MPEANQTEKATPQRRKKAREQGQIARSRELPSLLAMAAAAGALLLMGSGMAAHWRSFYAATLASASSDSLSADGPLFFWTSVEVLRWTVPILLLSVATSVAAGYAQGGFNVAPAALQPKFERLSPQSRLKQIFSSASLSSLGKSLLPFAVICLLGVHALSDNWSAIEHASLMDVRALVSIVGSIAWTLTWKSGLVLLVWAVIDYALLWRRNEAQLRMSKEELKQEFKQNDGNPQVKGRRRKLQRAMRARKPLQAVQTATLVVTNPTHFAVALRYQAPMTAPEVVAKGRDLVAQRIKEIAREHGITTMENKPLAQALYKSVEVGDSIPAELYQAVAELLVAVYRAEAELREKERTRRSKNAFGEVAGTP